MNSCDRQFTYLTSERNSLDIRTWRLVSKVCKECEMCLTSPFWLNIKNACLKSALVFRKMVYILKSWWRGTRTRLRGLSALSIRSLAGDNNNTTAAGEASVAAVLLIICLNKTLSKSRPSAPVTLFCFVNWRIVWFEF